MTIRQAVTELRDLLASADLEAPRRQAEWILEEVCGLTRVELLTTPERSVSPEEWSRCIELTHRRLKGEPIQYVLQQAQFRGMSLRVTPDVLIPRPETEQLVTLLLDNLRDITNPRVLDVGTGSGCIALAVKASRPDARVWGCDVEPGALRVAACNRSIHGLAVSLFQTDALTPGFAGAFAGVLDVIVSNPPYVAESERRELPREVRDFEPERALFASDDPLIFYRHISDEARRVLRPGGFLLFEVHEDRAEEVSAILTSALFHEVSVHQDFAHKNRFVMGKCSG